MLKIVKYNTKKEESQMMKDFFTPDEFLNSNYYKSCSKRSQNLVRVLFNKLMDADVEFLVKKRAGNDIILVAPSRIDAGSDKNILTAWILVGSIDIEIRGGLLPRSHFYTEEQLDDKLIEKAKRRYTEIK